MISDEELKSSIMRRWKAGELSKSIDTIIDDVLKENISKDPDLTKDRVKKVFAQLFLHG